MQVSLKYYGLRVTISFCTFWFENDTLIQVRYRSSRPVVFCEKGVLRIFVKFTGNACARVYLLIKLQTAPATLLKKRLWHRCFPVIFAKFLRTPFFYRTPLVAAFLVKIDLRRFTEVIYFRTLKNS